MLLSCDACECLLTAGILNKARERGKAVSGDRLGHRTRASSASLFQPGTCGGEGTLCPMTPFAGKTLKTIDYSTHWQNIVGLVDSGTSGDFPRQHCSPFTLSSAANARNCACGYPRLLLNCSLPFAIISLLIRTGGGNCRRKTG